MARNVPVCLLSVLEGWFSRATSCVKWDGVISDFFRLHTGVRQGSVLAPALFAVYVNDLVGSCRKNAYGHLIMYADDILLISRSVIGLQSLFDAVEIEITLSLIHI